MILFHFIPYPIHNNNNNNDCKNLMMFFFHLISFVVMLSDWMVRVFLVVTLAYSKCPTNAFNAREPKYFHSALKRLFKPVCCCCCWGDIWQWNFHLYSNEFFLCFSENTEYCLNWCKTMHKPTTIQSTNQPLLTQMVNAHKNGNNSRNI